MIGHSLLCASEHDGPARLNICGLQKWGHKYPNKERESSMWGLSISIPTVELLYLLGVRLQLAKRLACRPCDHHRDPVALGTVGGSGRALAELRDPE